MMVDGDVYFRVSHSQDYGKLSRRSAEDLLAGARVEVDELKEDPRDFAAVEVAEARRTRMGQPLGSRQARAGTSSAARCPCAIFKKAWTFTGGGADLIFPHHENEIAQSESASQRQPFARFWLHNGLLSIDEDKMSKSIGNVISVGRGS